ncbi:hypothetical protein G4B88_025291 [Cannabis sativa]|uniref:Uncharacterized protein n=1 Tax=Cannabis sativa TaxID=3483 RepID=A0A7J6DSB6_CANSA|nr:hypothetical protein G4B88_025290 [Cannabis sativa]KAF4348991.1 hypothetical protein G4B88_025291 [Cannabis sativa]
MNFGKNNNVFGFSGSWNWRIMKNNSISEIDFDDNSPNLSEKIKEGFGPSGLGNLSITDKLVLPNGSILKCNYYALPTRDSLFEDPLHDGKTMLKIWNLNKYTGVLGSFNFQRGETEFDLNLASTTALVYCPTDYKMY